MSLIAVESKPPVDQQFGASFTHQLKLVFERSVRVLKRDTLFIRQRIFQIVLQGVMLGTIFFNEGNAQLKISVLFVLMVILSMSSLAIINTTIDNRNVFYKQRDANFFMTSVYTFAEMISQWPLMFVETVIIGLLTYFLVGFTTSTRFLVFFLCLFMSNALFVQLFRAISAFSFDAKSGQGIAMGIMALTFCFSGYLVTESNIPDYFIWIYWITPYSWIFRVLVQNEFSSSDYASPVPCGPFPAMLQQIKAGTYNINNYQIYCQCDSNDFVASSFENNDVSDFANIASAAGVQTSGTQYWACREGDIFLNLYQFSLNTDFIGYGFIYMIVFLIISFGLYNYGMHYKRLGRSVNLKLNTDGLKRRRLIEGEKRRRKLKDEECRMRRGLSSKKDSKREVEKFTSLEQVDTFLKNFRHQPVEVDLVLHNLSYSVQLPDKSEKKLLCDVNGVFTPGTMTALMGSSGAGKTTLLDVVAGKKTSGKIDGHILVNGLPKDDQVFPRISGYVEQNDIHEGLMTVYESIVFSAVQRLPEWLTHEEKMSFVEMVIYLIDLEDVRNKIIGEDNGGLSVEQIKRVTIAVEMVSNPSVLFLDEPTSGLDSRSARIVMKAIRRVVDIANRTVVCTIHQPSFEIFSIFDNLLLLKRGGFVVYNGDLGPPIAGTIEDRLESGLTDGPDTFKHNSGKLMIDYFCNLDENIKYRHGQNPAEFMLEVIGAGTVGSEYDVDFTLAYVNSEMHTNVIRNIESVKTNSPNTNSNLTDITMYASSLSTQLYYSIYRWTTVYYRSVSYNLSRSGIVLIIALLFGLTIINLDLNNVPAVNSFNGDLFAAIFFTAAIQATTTVPILGNRKILYYKETDSRTYRAFAYLVGLTVAEVPWLLINTAIHVIVYYSVAGLYSDAEYITEYCIAMFLFICVMAFFGQMLSAVLPSVHMAQLLAGMSMGLMNLYAGFYMPGNSIPYPWRIFYYILPARYGLKALIPPQFYCSLSCFNDVNCQTASYCAADSGLSNCIHELSGDGPGCNLIRDTSGILQKFDLKSTTVFDASVQSPLVTVWDYWSTITDSSFDSRYSMMYALIAFLVGFKLITLLCLRYLKQIKR